MNRQWMYGDRHTSEYIKGVHDFVEVAEANKQRMVFCVVHALNVGIRSLTLIEKSFTPTCFTRVSCHTIMFGRGTEKYGL